MSDTTDEGSDTVGSSPRIGTDEALTLLADGCRRRLLIELMEREPDDSVRIRPDADDSRVDTNELPSDGGTDDVDRAFDRLAVELYHNHLPRLAAEDVISWDEEDDAVERGTAFSELKPFVERLDQHREELPSDWRPTDPRPGIRDHARPSDEPHG
ncbi:DUF7344 domain-containing protein [Halorubrum sp. DTA98]|uniref:DUF7344 domain-containing protein n=1 Tax=Halorubrum sp. DTA98 TaxID=3402163 RepID=UPI003AAFC3A5